MFVAFVQDDKKFISCHKNHLCINYNIYKGDFYVFYSLIFADLGDTIWYFADNYSFLIILSGKSEAVSRSDGETSSASAIS